MSWSARLFIRSFASLEDMFSADDEAWAIYHKIVTITLPALLFVSRARAELRLTLEHCSCIIRRGGRHLAVTDSRTETSHTRSNVWDEQGFAFAAAFTAEEIGSYKLSPLIEVSWVHHASSLAFPLIDSWDTNIDSMSTIQYKLNGMIVSWMTDQYIVLSTV